MENASRDATGYPAMEDKPGGPLKAGKARVLWGAGPAGGTLAVAGLGPREPPPRPHEGLQLRDESVRRAAGAGLRALREAVPGPLTARVDEMGAPRAAAEGATLAAFCFQEYKREAARKPPVHVELIGEDSEERQRGLAGARCQNWARALMERPGNELSPRALAHEAAAALEPLGVRVLVRDRSWAEEQRMRSFLSVAQGSAEPPVFIEMHYDNSGTEGSPPMVLVGKGVTFDSGGLSLKPSAKMAEMRGDMGGAAVVCGALRAAASLQLPVHLVGLVPATENMPGGRATRPGDVVTARNGKSVLIDNTDAEGRLILADALCYAHEFNPLLTIDLATLTGAMRVALGDAASGLWSTDEDLATALLAAGYASGDRLWRMPLYQRYSDRVTGFDSVDVHNVGKATGAGSCTAAAFLKEFAPPVWAHVDIAGVMGDTEDQPYLGGAGMTGRPLRTIVEFIRTYKKTPQ